MLHEERQSPAMRLEGLVLGDEHGNLYEVPCLVIERYRVTEERAKDLTTAHTEADSTFGDRWEAAKHTPWAVRGAVYTRAMSCGDERHGVRPVQPPDEPC